MKKFLIGSFVLLSIAGKVLCQQSQDDEIEFDEKNVKQADEKDQTPKKLNLEYRRNPIELNKPAKFSSETETTRNDCPASPRKFLYDVVPCENPSQHSGSSNLTQHDFSWHDAREGTFSPSSQVAMSFAGPFHNHDDKN